MRPPSARRPTLLLLLLIIQSTHTFKSLAVVSKIIIDQVKGATRPGGGGVQAAAGARLGGDQGLSIALHAPVGMDFDDALLEQLIEDKIPAPENVFSLVSEMHQRNEFIAAYMGAAETGNGLFRLMKSLRHESTGAGDIAARLGIKAPVMGRARVPR